MPKLGLSSSLVTPSLSSVLGPLGFPLRLRITSSSLGFTANLLQIENGVDGLFYVGTNCYLLFAKTINGVTEIGINDDIYSLYPAWSAGATTIPRTGWDNNFVVSEAITTSVTITATTPQTFTYNASIPSISFSNNQSLSSNYFDFNPSLSSPAGTRTTAISLIEDADYVATNSPSVVYTINKKNVTIALTSQNSTYAPNQNYSASAPVAITSLSGADTISGSFASLLTGVPATGANAGSYTISFNPNYTSTNYNITNSPASVTWTISKADQTISFNPTLTGTNGQTQNLSASSTSGLSVSFSVVSGPATLNGSTLTYTGTGNVVVRASQAGNTNYNPASDVDRTITITAAGSGIPLSTQNILLGGFVTDGFLNINPPLPLAKVGGIWKIVNGSQNNPTNATISVGYVANESKWFINLQNQGEDGFYYTAATNTAPSTEIPTTGWVLDPSTTGSITITAA